MRWRPQLTLDRTISGKLLKQFGFVVVIFLSLLCLITIVNYNSGQDDSFGYSIVQSFVDMTNADSLHSEFQNNQSTSGKVWWLAAVYLLGAVAFSGVLIATITNIIRLRASKFRSGAVSYRFKGHIVFLGYNNLVANIIHNIFEKENEKVWIVVGVEDKASIVSDKIKNRLWEKNRRYVVTLKADSCNREDLERLRIPHAKEVYIIGEHDDAYNLKCYRTIYELSLKEPSSKNRMPQCYVNLQSQSTLALFRTYASAGEIGVDFTNFHAFNFKDEWASALLLKDSTRFKNFDECHNHIIIAGMTEMGVFIAQEAVLLCHYPNTHTTITFVDDAAEMHKKDFIAEHQKLFEHSDMLDVDFEFVEGGLSDDFYDSSDITTVAICYDDPQQNITLGLNLPENIYGKDNVSVWVYQPTSGDLGKYLKNSRYKNVVTFGMSGDLLDIRNKKNTQIAKRINHYFRRCNEAQIDYSNQRLIEMEWEELSIYDRWSCLRRAIFTSVLSQYEANFSVMAELERRRSVAEDLLFPSKTTEPIDYTKYIKSLKEDICPEMFNK